MHKTIRYALLVLSALLVLPGIALAHATVFPKEVTAASFEKFVLRVPTEKESATVKVVLEVPAGFEVSRVKPVAGWQYVMQKSPDGKLATAVTWSGGQILPGEFMEFELSGKAAKDPGKYAWRVLQTYADGETVSWTGASDAKTPASVMEVKAGAGAADGHAATPAPGTTPAPAPAAPSAPAPAATAAPAPVAATSPAVSMLPTVAAYGGLLMGAAALVLTLRRR